MSPKEDQVTISSNITTKVDCSKVMVAPSTLHGDGVFSSTNIQSGELVEHGLVRHLPADFDGSNYPYCWPWKKKNNAAAAAAGWAIPFGAAPYYNCSTTTSANVQLSCMYDQDRFEIHALRDIAAGEELLLDYESLDYDRPCFQELKSKASATAISSSSIDVTTTQSKIHCHNVLVQTSTLGDFDGAYVTCDFSKGDLVEYGIARRLPKQLDGHTFPFCFTWSNQRPCPTYAVTSGCAVFYNCVRPDQANAEMKYFHEEDRFQVHALRDLKAGEELLWTYISLGWRGCFQDVKDILYSEEEEVDLGKLAPPTVSSLASS